MKNVKHLAATTYGVRNPFGPVLEMRFRTHQLKGWKVVVVIVTRDLCLSALLTQGKSTGSRGPILQAVKRLDKAIMWMIRNGNAQLASIISQASSSESPWAIRAASCLQAREVLGFAIKFRRVIASRLPSNRCGNTESPTPRLQTR